MLILNRRGSGEIPLLLLHLSGLGGAPDSFEHAHFGQVWCQNLKQQNLLKNQNIW